MLESYFKQQPFLRGQPFLRRHKQLCPTIKTTEDVLTMKMLFFALLLAQLGIGVNTTNTLSERKLVRRLNSSAPPPLPQQQHLDNHPQLKRLHLTPLDARNLQQHTRLQTRQQGHHREGHRLPTRPRPSHCRNLQPAGRRVLCAPDLLQRRCHLRVQRQRGEWQNF